MTTTAPATPEEVRPVWAEVDLDAISHNINRIRERAGRPIKLLVPIKANAYGHGVVAVSRHLETLGVDGLATANVDDALAARRAGVTLPILMYGSQLPGGIAFLLEHDLTPSIYSHTGLREVAGLAAHRDLPISVHIKVDAGMGRLGVRLDEAAELVRSVVATANVNLEGFYTHIPFGDEVGEAWSRRRLQAFTELVRAIEEEHNISIEYAQASASSLLSQGVPDGLNTIAPGHLTFGLHPVTGMRAEAIGLRKALRSLRAKLIHVGMRRVGDDPIGPAPTGNEESTVGVVLFGMDNGYRRNGDGDAFMLCRGQRCRVLSISAEYTVIDLTEIDAPCVGDVVTIVGQDQDQEISVEEVAEQLGAPSAAYWMLCLKGVPYRYGGP